MNVDLNPRGNGACPLCVYVGNCRIRKTLKTSVSEIKIHDGSALEIVIYTCPEFKESD
jgi:hypothetical protein